MGGGGVVDFSVRLGAGEVAIAEQLEQFLPDGVGGTVLAGAVHRDVEADMLVRIEPQIGVEEFRVAAMRDHFMAVDRLLVEAQLHARQVRHEGQRRHMHHPRGFGLEDLLVAELAVLQMGDHEAADIVAGGGETPRRGHRDQLVAVRRHIGLRIPLRHARLQIVGQRLMEAGMLHLQRREDMVLDIDVERLTRNPLDDIAGQRGRVV